MVVGRIIRQLRSAKGIGIRELERLTGINRGNLSKIERGAGFGPSQLNRIASRLDTTPAVIFTLSEIMANQPDMLENADEISRLCKNLTRLLNAYLDSPNGMQKEIDIILEQIH